MGPVTRLIQTGIGLAAELKAAKEERKAAQVPKYDGGPIEDNAKQMQDLRASEQVGEMENMEADRQFMGGGGVDDNNEPVAPDSDDIPPPYSEEELATTEDIKYPSPYFSAAPPKLSCPVVIPQRRPGSKARGFMRAYAPVLADYDIDEKAFLDILKAFHKASLASPILNVITVGAGALGAIPEPFTMLAAISISVLSGAAAELQGRHRTNNYLAQANEHFFKPRGLFCLVMSFRPYDVPKGDVSMAPVDTSNAALKWLSPSTLSVRIHASSFRTSSGTTHGEIEMPETAPLIYADTGYAELSKPKSQEEKRGSVSSSRKVAAAYFDKRAQAKYAYKHPDSALAIENLPQFASKYGDPTHPSVTTSYVGRVSARLKHESLAERQARKREKALQPGSARGAIRRILPNSVLYLMIVNLPTEEELAEARKAGEEISS